MSNNETFLAFQKYEFDKDEKFKAGLSNILKNQEDKAFDFNDYQAWKKKDKEEKEKEEEVEGEGEGKGNEKEIKDTKKEEEKEEESIYTTTVDGEKITVPPKFSFQEIIEMIETGKEIPGIRQIPNQLNEGTPSQAKLTARPKPWEKDQ
ncbi:unnamed protein product [Cunninghamella echinulata]